jgi:hypothetical protein
MDFFADTPDRDYAVVIGIEEYEHKRFSKLTGARSDAEAFVKWLRNKRHADARFESKEHIITRIKQASFSAVSSAFTELLDKAPSGGRRLYIFVSGHGFGQTVHDASLYCSDYSDYTEHGYCSLIETANWFKYVGKFSEVVVFIDCCRHYDTTLGSRRILRGGQQRGRPAAHFYFMSCALGEASEERTIAGEYCGVFSFNVIRALGGKVENVVDASGKVTAHSLVRHVRQKVPPTMHPHFDPPDEQILRNLVLARGFEPKPDTFLIDLREPTRGFSLFSGESSKLLTPLQWVWEWTGERRVTVYRENEEAVIVAVPKIASFNSEANDRRYLPVQSNVTGVVEI